MISKEREAEVLRLFNAERWPVGTIASQLGLHHTTVQRVLAHAGLAPKLVIKRPSIVDPYLPFIVETLNKFPRLTASRVKRAALGKPPAVSTRFNTAKATSIVVTPHRLDSYDQIHKENKS